MHIMIIGDHKVGKTSLLKCFDKTEQTQPRLVNPDYIEASYQSKEGHEIKVRFWDNVHR